MTGSGSVAATDAGHELPARCRFVVNPDLVGSWIDDEIVVMSVSTGKYHTMNLTAATIWELLREPQAEQQIVASMLAKFEVDKDECVREVAECIQQLQRRGLIVNAT